MTLTLLSPAMRKNLEGRIAKWRSKLKDLLPPDLRYIMAGIKLAGARTAKVSILVGLLAGVAWWANRLSERYRLEADELYTRIDQTDQKDRDIAESSRKREETLKLAAKLKAEGFTAPFAKPAIAERIAALAQEEGRKDFVFELGPETVKPIPGGEGATLIQNQITMRFKVRDPARIVELPARIMATTAGLPLLLDSADIRVDKTALDQLDRGEVTNDIWPLDVELRFDWISGRIVQEEPAGKTAVTPQAPASPRPANTRGSVT